MKTVLYITKNKIWAGESVFDWNGVSLDEVFGRIKKELKIDNARIVLGNDVSFVVAIKMGDTFVSRENVLKMVKPWMSFEIDNECFDWKTVVLTSQEEWIQVVATEKELLLSLSSAVLKHGLKIDLITSIGVVLGEIAKDREVPVIIRWHDKEKLSVVAVNGLTDLVVSDIPEDDLMTYTSRKWGLAVNPETIVLTKGDFNLSDRVFSEKTKGDDRFVLNLPILKHVVTTEKLEEEFGEKTVTEKKEASKSQSRLWILVTSLLIVLGVVVMMIYKTGLFKSMMPIKITEVSTPTISPTAEITIKPTPVDLEVFNIQVLNGGGVVGEAARIKMMLVDQGFENVDIGNTMATTEGIIKFKTEVPKFVLDLVEKSTVDYMMATSDLLMPESKYDLTVVIGSEKNINIVE